MPSVQNTVLILNGVTTKEIISALKKEGIEMEYCQDEMTEEMPDTFFFLITKKERIKKTEKIPKRYKPNVTRLKDKVANQATEE